ncbi:DUF4910 domain-containing protein [Roseospira navarrensis]|uniref:DUF4910 domain-containing protein n=1 Tax=Roseospira navarrensis TaxID=140058 RepID=A0A7X1ZJU1_9PROT|nr:DUF4910 domain-containing protein [Roseospira navarrensis]MQX38580.1 DUF4910 domain-containing protein [Roseospira navarrensis]
MEASGETSADPVPPSDPKDAGDIGQTLHGWARDLFPIRRSITGNGVRRTLAYLKDRLPGLTLHEVPTGTPAFDWAVPDEWNVTEAYVEDESGRRVIDWADHTLHLMGYAEPVDAWMSRAELDAHLYSLPEHPDWIPYITSYYRRRWGFCLPHRQREALPEGRYHVVIRSTLEPGSLTYADLVLPGREPEEVLLSTYICHPSMANNELSGPVVTTALAQWLAALPDRRWTYRIVFLPETIGSIVYLSRHLETMRARTLAGFVVTCVGDERDYSLMPSRLGGTLADRVATHVLDHRVPRYTPYSFLTRGSDERQYCSPGVDLPVVSIMRSKYATYPEYHTSADDLSLVTPAGLAGAYGVLRDALGLLEHHGYYRMTSPCEPQLGKRGLYPTLSTKESGAMVRNMMNVIAYCDGRHDLLDLARVCGLYAGDVVPILETLQAADLCTWSKAPSDRGA